MTATKRDIISYGFVFLFSLAMLLYVIPTFSPEYPGYGVPATLVPNIACGSMLFLALTGLAKTFVKSRRDGAGETISFSIRWLHLAMLFLPCLLLMPAMHHLGFIPSGIVFLLLLQWICGQRAWISLALVSVLPVVLVYVIMRYGLGVPMP